MPRFVALDPSSTITGWAVFQDQGLVAWGKLDATNVEYSFRFQFVINALVYLARKYGFQEIAIEDVRTAWHSKYRQRNIAGLQIVFTSIRKWAEKNNIPLTAYNPATWKKTVIGNYRASKEMTKTSIRYRFPAIPDNLTDHEYDAIGIGVCHGALRFQEALAKGGS